MNSTNGTQPSENESMRGDMSYLYGRDPSILAYGQRPFPSEETKKNLNSLLEEEQDENALIESKEKLLLTSTADTSIVQTIKVFLRMKPFPYKMKVKPNELEAYTILNSTTLLTKMPSLDNNTSCLKKTKSNVVCRKFIFTQTFGPETSQLELFEHAVKPQMIDFLAGKNSVVMSYGTTNSGKTYTLQGTAESPGIIPRGIEFVFSNINPKTMPSYKVVNSCDVVYLDTVERLNELDIKMKLFSYNAIEKNHHITTYKQMQRLLHAESPMASRNYDAHYSVWISFVEIYNETIYDLLWNSCQKKRPALKLATDSKGRAFIKGLKSICVNSGAEAYQVLMAGQDNLKVAATALNARSSRSHCIFTIKLLKYRTENDSQSVDVSVFSFCDLAGSERLKKTLNVGERLKEAQNINTSLLVLGRCLKTIYESQTSKQKNESIGPFRESKLTRLFQRALSGREQIALIVNVNPVPNLHLETQNVLNFSAIAKKIIIERISPVKQRHSHSRFSRLVTQNIKTDMDWENTELEDMTEETEECTEQESDDDDNDQEAYEDLLIENKMLKKEVKELEASAFTRDIQTRKEIIDKYSEIMKNLEADYKNRMIDMEEQHEDLRELAVERIELFYKEKLNQLSARNKSRSSLVDEDEDDDEKLLDDLEMKNTRLTAKIDTLKKSIQDLKQMKEAVESEKTKVSFELAVAKEKAKHSNELLIAAQKSIVSEDASANYIYELNEIITKKNDRIKKMKTFLNEAKEEYISITDHAQELENQIKVQEDLIAENTEHIRDLEEQLTQANAYSAEQNKVIDNLEEELEKQTKKLIESEEKVESLSKELLAINCLDKKISENLNQQVTNEELEKTKSQLEEMKNNYELMKKENSLLNEKLDQQDNEIQSLKNNLDSTKGQLDKVTEKINILSIEDAEEKASKIEIKVVTVEQSMQTEIEISKEINPSIANISCQTIEIEQPFETLEKSLQTSLRINQSFDGKESIEEITRPESVDKEIFDDLQKQYDEVKNSLEKRRKDEEESQKQFEDHINNLQTQITAMKVEKQENIERVSILQRELEEVLKKSEEKIKDLQISIETQESKNEDLMNRVTRALAREQDKDKEIDSLQKEMKKLIQSNEATVKKVEVEIKTVLKDLTSTKDELLKAQEKNKKIDKDYKQVIHILEIKIGSIEQKMLEKSTENEKLKLKIDELEKALGDAEHELVVFTRNRDETVSKYEDLVDSQRDELDRQKKEITKLQLLLQEFKENAVYPTPCKRNTKKTRTNLREEKRKAKMLTTDGLELGSEEDNCENIQSEKPKSKKEFLTPNKDNIPLIELSGSESKRSVKSASKDQPTCTRQTRRKRLFTPLDESYVDIEPSEQPPPSPSLSTRSLRNRRK